MANEKILIVEDDDILAAQLQELLTSLGYMVPRPLAAGEDAIAVVKALLPDLILMDIELSGALDGIAAVRQIQSLSDIPIVYLTAYSEDTRLCAAKATRPYGYLVKPVSSQQLQATIEMALYKSALDRKLKESEERYRAIFDGVLDGICMTAWKTGQVLAANEMFCRMTGYRQEELAGLTVNELYPGLDRSSRNLSFECCPGGAGTQVVEHPVRRKDHTLFQGDIRTRHIRCGEDKCILWIVRDLSDRKQAEEERLRLESQLRRAQKMEAIGTLAGGIAHDFNNILASIIGYTEMAVDQASALPRVVHDLRQVLKAANRAKDLVSQILTFSRQKEEEYQPVQIYAILKEALKLLRASLPATIEIVQNFEPPHCLVFADPSQIHQVIMNLCTNAGYAMREKGGVLKVSATRVEMGKAAVSRFPFLEPGSYLKISVADTGQGMDQTTMQRIFEPYFTTKEAGQGSGLGLAMVHGIVERHRGAIEVVSEPGKGTRFDVFLPALELQPLTEQGEPPEVPGGNERILIVEDEPQIVEVTERVLSTLGYRVLAINCPVEALRLFEETNGQFDLVMTDYSMPRMTGFDFARRVWSLRSDMPVVLCTGYNDVVTREKVLQMGFRGFALKPLDRLSLARLVRSVLDGRPH